MSKVIASFGALVAPDEIPGSGIWTVAANQIGTPRLTAPLATSGEGGKRARYIAVHGRVHKLDAGGANVTFRMQGNHTGQQVSDGVAAANTLHAKTTAAGSDAENVAVATAAPETQKTITAASNATPIVITSAAHGYSTGDLVMIESVAGNLAANGTWRIRVLTANTFELVGSVGSGAYTSGGVANKYVFFTAIFSFGSSASNVGHAMPIPYPYVNMRISNTGASYSAGNIYIDCVEMLD